VEKGATVATVLVVEDEDVTRLLLETSLRGAGHWVRAAASVAEAQAELAHSGVPEVLVTDMFMPGGSGLSLVNALRADPLLAEVPVIFLSGRALPGDVEAGESLGATYLTKPLSMPQLTAAIEAALLAGPTALDGAVRNRVEELGGAEDDEERGLFTRLLTLFVEQAPVSAEAVERAVAAGNAADLETSAHRLKGAAATLGADRLARLCGELEDRARAGEVPAAVPVRTALRREVATACRVFRELAEELGSTD
jgi:CheY-like chemotaxis protein/HPt (histidine-containing phosphotransfer) domain-containing protein